MIRSMTGFAAVSREEAGYRVSVTTKSVNHRFLDIALKTPQTLSSIDTRLRQRVQQRLARGRVEIMLSVESLVPPEREVVLDEPLLRRIVLAFDAAAQSGLVTGGLTASDLLRVPQLMEIRQRTEAAAEGAAFVESPAAALAERVMDEALDALVVMRETEGRFLAGDLDARVRTLAGHVDTLEHQAREGQSMLEARLRERLATLPADLQPDSAAVSQEVVRFVARSDVEEEVVRLRGHVEHWRALSESPDPCGRKLDFLVQEMNREINTIGSKVEGPGVGQVVIDAKAELERIREQVQNVE